MPLQFLDFEQPIAELEAKIEELRFLAEDAGFDRFFRPGRDGHHQFDLAAFVAADLAGAGVTRVASLVTTAT